MLSRFLPLFNLRQVRTVVTAAAPRKWATSTRTPYKSKATLAAEALKTIPASIAVVEENELGLEEDLKDIEHLIPSPSLTGSPTTPYEPLTSTPKNSVPSPLTNTDYPTTPFPIASSIPNPSPESAVQTKEIDWANSFHGLSSQPFSVKAAAVLMGELKVSEIEIKPDGLLYLPEIIYRRKLNQAFGPGGWGMVPRGEMTVAKTIVSREWALIAGGRLVSIARGEQTFFDPSGLPTATEGCKSNALMRCCKDLGIASELWDPAFIRVFKSAHCIEAWTEHVVSKKKARRWRKKGNKFEYPLKESPIV